MARAAAPWAGFSRREKPGAISPARGINSHPLPSAVTLFLCDYSWPLNNGVGAPTLGPPPTVLKIHIQLLTLCGHFTWRVSIHRFNNCTLETVSITVGNRLLGK